MKKIFTLAAAAVLLSFCLPAQDLMLKEAKNATGPTCPNGSLEFYVDGGCPPKKKKLAGPGATGGFTDLASSTVKYEGLVPGEYTFTVTDALCGIATLTATVGYGDFAFVANKKNPTTCSPEDNSGSITLAVVGNAGPFTFNWSGPGINTSNSHNQNQTNLVKGGYVVTITSQQACVGSKVLNINLCCCESGGQTSPCSPPSGSCYQSFMLDVNCQPKPLEIQVVSANNPSVLPNGTTAGDGSIFVSVFGGSTSTYAYKWSGPNGFSASTNSISNLIVGLYSLTVTDGCNSATETVVLGNCPGPIPLALTPSAACPGGKSGKIFVVGNGFTPIAPPYTIKWSKDGGAISSKEASITPGVIDWLEAGSYSITVIDANNCSNVVPTVVATNEDYASSGVCCFYMDVESDDACMDSWPFQPSRVKIDCGYPAGCFCLSPTSASYQVVWPNNTESTVNWSAHGSDYDCEIVGPDEYHVDEPGAYTVKFTDKYGCVVREQCFSFGESQPLSGPGISNFSQYGLGDILGIDKCFTCQSCGGFNCGEPTNPPNCDDGQTHKLLFSPNNDYNPCSTGGSIGNCGDEVEIPDYVVGVEMIDWTSGVTFSEGVCQYDVVCYYPENVLEDDFFNGMPAYIKTKVLIRNPQCTTQVVHSPPGYELYYQLCADSGGVPLTETIDPDQCLKKIWCLETNPLTGFTGVKTLIFSGKIGTKTCMRENAFGSCDLIEFCPGSTDKEIQVIQENVLCDYTKLCDQVRPETLNSSQRSVELEIESLTAPLSNSLERFEIHPNPFSNSFTVFVEATSTRKAKFVLVDLLGKQIMSEDFNLETGKNAAEIMPNHNLPPGIYFGFLIEKGKIVGYKKMVKTL